MTISPFGISHKILLKSTRKGIKPLEIILDDSELSDLTRCLDVLRYDPRFNIRWDTNYDKPFSKQYIVSSLYDSKKNYNFLYALIIFLFTCSLLLIIPTNNKYELKDSSDFSESSSKKLIK